MSPTLVNRFPADTRIFGGRQGARSIHFLMLIGFIANGVVHVMLVALTGFARNMNRIVLGVDDERPTGVGPGIHRHSGRGAVLGGGSLHLVAFPTAFPACGKGAHAAGKNGYA
jgi:hypothetical protein